MRYLICLILTSILFSNSIWAQEADIPQEKWNDIVDYANAKATMTYLDVYTLSKALKEEINFYESTLKPKLELSSLKAPVSYSTIQLLMESHFKKTFEKLTSQIDLVKSKPRELDTLYNTLHGVLKDVNLEESQRNSLINRLKTEINKSSNIKSQEDPMAGFTPKTEIGEERQKPSIINISNIVIGTLILLTFFLAYLIIKRGKRISSLEYDLGRLRRDSQFGKLAVTGNRNVSGKAKMRIQELERELQEAKEFIERLLNESKKEIGSESAVVVEFDVPTPPPAPKEFYAGKPTTDRKFAEVSDKIKEQETVFKFTFTDSSRTKAFFEVIIASEFMKRQIINAPDDFLYRVCNNSNSNQDFRREVVTERKGIAQLREGVWVVDENDKALIKFQ